MINFLHTFTPSALAFSVGTFAIHWYGLCIVAGIVVGLSVIVKFAKEYNISSDDIFDAAFYVVLCGIVGARIYSVFLDWNYYLQHSAQIIAVWNGGLAIHGAIIGGAAALLAYTAKHRQSFWRWADVIVLGLPLGQALGRFGNYFNQEIFGTPTNLPWGIPIAPEFRPSAYQTEQYFHPTFLYESILNLLNFFILLLASKSRFVRRALRPGDLFFIYLINYSLIRITMEFWRTDTAPLVFGIRWPVLFSLGLIVAVAIFWLVSRKSHKAVI